MPLQEDELKTYLDYVVSSTVRAAYRETAVGYCEAQIRQKKTIKLRHLVVARAMLEFQNMQNLGHLYFRDPKQNQQFVVVRQIF